MFFEINSAINSVIWGPPMLAVFLGTGLFLSAKTGFYQIFGAGDWIKSTVGSLIGSKEKQSTDKNGISQAGALASSLAACLGTGNIVGVATALRAGGAGSVFWMCVSAILGMMTCCCENILGIKYRIRNSSGKPLGGPMYYIEKGLGMNNLARVYAVFLIGASLGMGNMTQSNSVAQGLSAFGIKPAVTGFILCTALLLAVSGGLKRITAVSEKLIPVLSGAFVLACFAVIFLNRENIIPCIKNIISEAFTVKAVSGFGIAKAMRYGISRGVFSNEAGLGSCAIIHSSAECDDASEQGKWGILEVFIDTVFMCTVTAAAILTSGKAEDKSLDGVELCAAVFESFFGKWGGYFLDVCICLFAFATLIAWSYYGKTGTEYLFGAKSGKIYNIVYILAAFAGCVTKLDFVWSISDTFNGLMAVPNIFALWCLSKEAVTELNKNRLHGKIRTVCNFTVPPRHR
ncbi:MAG: sodium:alanine symporter family protein [Clostridia bacterium]|nr:sodium:alanine symporter family protein [Clostridia bacterium]